jgi:hypothetical protein
MDVGRMVAALLLAGAGGGLLGQGWELGAGGGYGIYRNGSVYATAGVVSAGARNRFTITAWLGENSRGRWSAEVRYTYQDGDPFLEAGGVQTNVQGQSHCVHYALVGYLGGSSARLRPYLTAGLGAKAYEVTGPETLNPPFTEIAHLRAVREWKPVVVGGGGVRLRVGPMVELRFELLDYVTPFPKELIEPVPYATARGFLHQFTPSMGIAFTWKGEGSPAQSFSPHRRISQRR